MIFEGNQNKSSRGLYLGIVLVLALGAIALVLFLNSPTPPTTQGPLLARSGYLEITSPNKDEAILKVSDIDPGQQATGVFTLKNTTSRPIDLEIIKTYINSSPGIGGGLLETRLSLKIDNGQANIYRGPLSEVKRIALSKNLAPGVSRNFRFFVMFEANKDEAIGLIKNRIYLGSKIEMGFRLEVK